MELVTIYLDESGDLGFDFNNKGTPRYFIITLLVCRNKKTVEHVKNAVKKTLKNKLHSKKQRPSELKGTGTTIDIKKYFYSHMSQSTGWELHSIVLDKHKLLSDVALLPTEHRIYNYLAKEIIGQVDVRDLKSGLILTVDKRKGKKGIKEFNKYLTNHLEAMLPLNVMYDISHEQSHDNLLLQAVDLFCWGIRRLYEYKDDGWYLVYKSHINLVEVNSFSGIKKDSP